MSRIDCECPICMEHTAATSLLGCDHAFCLTCIGKWTLDHEACCPLCRQPIFALYSRIPGVHYLTPHHGTFGLTITKFKHSDEAVVTDVADDSVADALGIPILARIAANGQAGYTAVTEVLRTALEQKRMVRVEVSSRTAVAPRPTSDASPWQRCCRWIRHTDDVG